MDGIPVRTSAKGDRVTTMTTTSPEGRDPGEILAAIAAAHGTDAAEALIDEFLSLTEPLNKSIAVALCRDFKVDRNTWLDDFCQFVRIAAMHLVREIAENPKRMEEIASWRALLTFRARSATTAFLDSTSGFNQVSGMVGVKRRVREMEKTRAAMYAELQREPTDHEVVEETNRRLAETRSDYKRQGMECKVEDLHVAQPSVAIENSQGVADMKVHVDDDSDLHSTERDDLIDGCIAACTIEDPRLGEIAKLWFAPARTGGDGEHPTAAHIARTLGIEPSTARAKVTRVRSIAQRIAREQYGIRRERAG